MRNLKSRIVLVCIIIMTSVSLASMAIAASVQTLDVNYVQMQFTFDEEQLAPPSDQQGFLYNNRTYLPLRFVVHSLNQAVEWDGDTYTVTIKSPTEQEQQEVEAYNKGNRVEKKSVTGKPQSKPAKIKATMRKITYIIDGKKVEPEPGMEGMILNGRLFVPLRFVSDSIGYDIEWNQETYSVAVISGNDPESEDKPIQDEGSAADVDGSADVGGVAGGGSGGGVPAGGSADEAYNSIISGAEGQIAALRTSCQNDLFELLDDYLAANTAEEREAVIDQGWARVAACDVQFESIMSSLTNQLNAGGYSTTVVQTYRDQYAAEKADAEALLD